MVTSLSSLQREPVTPAAAHSLLTLDSDARRRENLSETQFLGRKASHHSHIKSLEVYVFVGGEITKFSAPIKDR